MGFLQNTNKFLGIGGTRKRLEQLQDTVAMQERLLVEAGVKADTFPSYVAREATRIDDVQGTKKRRVKVKDLQSLYLNNQFIFRGVNVRAEELVTRGYKILEGDEKGREACQNLVEDSGSENLFKQMSVNCDVAGDGYLEKINDKDKTKIVKLKHVNPVNFSFWTEKNNDDLIVVDKKGLPISYMQKIEQSNALTSPTPVGTSDIKIPNTPEAENLTELRIPVPIEKIAHLKFNTFGDEFTGISTIQPVYNTSIRLMNMEHAAAEAAVKSANPTWVVQTQTKSPADLARWANVLGRISAKEVVFLPKDVTVKLESPGNQNFSAYSDYFLDAVVAALGVPKSILTGTSDSGGGNRSTVLTLSKHFYSIIRSNQRTVETLFNEIFREYGEMAGFKPPKLLFNDIAEDADRNGQRAVDLFEAGILTIEEARELIGLETPENVKKDLEITNTANTAGKNIKEDAELKKSDSEAFFPSSGTSKQGSQKNIKKKQKMDSNVPSVR